MSGRIFFFGLCLVLLSVVAQSSFATTRSAAKAACEASAASADFPARHADCHTESSDSSGHRRFELQGDSKWDNVARVWLPPKMVFSYYWWELDDTPPPGDSACVSSAYPAVTSNFGDKILAGYSLCMNQTASDGSGLTVSCKRTMTPLSPPVLDPNKGWQTYARMNASSSLCASDAPGGWATASGEAATGTNPPPAAPPSPPVPPPSICGGGSCYDPASDSYCAVAGGKQICVPGSAGRGGSGSGSGACVSGSNATVCAGPAPNGAPSPPKPPDSPISDPPSEIRASDNTTQANPNTGANVTVNTNVYTAPGNSVSNGAKPGDSQPQPGKNCIADADGTQKCAPDGDPGDAYCVTTSDGQTHCVDKGDKGKASGGQTCDSPPICSGDQPTCMVVSQSWLRRCRAGFGEDQQTGQPNWTKVKPGDGDEYAVSDTPRSAVVDDGTGTGSGTGGGVGDIDQSGWAGNTCPALPSFEFFGHVISFDSTLFCNWLEMIRSIVLLVAGFVSARIIASGGKG